VRELQQGGDVAVGKLQDLHELVAVKPTTFFEHLRASYLKDVRHE
jgi:hypothetical protein